MSDRSDDSCRAIDNSTPDILNNTQQRLTPNPNQNQNHHHPLTAPPRDNNSSSSSPPREDQGQQEQQDDEIVEAAENYSFPERASSTRTQKYNTPRNNQNNENVTAIKLSSNLINNNNRPGSAPESVVVNKQEQQHQQPSPPYRPSHSAGRSNGGGGGASSASNNTNNNVPPPGSEPTQGSHHHHHQQFRPHTTSSSSATSSTQQQHHHQSHHHHATAPRIVTNENEERNRAAQNMLWMAPTMQNGGGGGGSVVDNDEQQPAVVEDGDGGNDTNTNNNANLSQNNSTSINRLSAAVSGEQQQQQPPPRRRLVLEVTSAQANSNPFEHLPSPHSSLNQQNQSSQNNSTFNSPQKEQHHQQHANTSATSVIDDTNQHQQQNQGGQVDFFVKTTHGAAKANIRFDSQQECMQLTETIGHGRVVSSSTQQQRPTSTGGHHSRSNSRQQNTNNNDNMIKSEISGSSVVGMGGGGHSRSNSQQHSHTFGTKGTGTHKRIVSGQSGSVNANTNRNQQQQKQSGGGGGGDDLFTPEQLAAINAFSGNNNNNVENNQNNNNFQNQLPSEDFSSPHPRRTISSQSQQQINKQSSRPVSLENSGIQQQHRSHSRQTSGIISVNTDIGPSKNVNTFYHHKRSTSQQHQQQQHHKTPSGSIARQHRHDGGGGGGAGVTSAGGGASVSIDDNNQNNNNNNSPFVINQQKGGNRKFVSFSSSMRAKEMEEKENEKNEKQQSPLSRFRTAQDEENEEDEEQQENNEDADDDDAVVYAGFGPREQIEVPEIPYDTGLKQNTLPAYRMNIDAFWSSILLIIVAITCIPIGAVLLNAAENDTRYAQFRYDHVFSYQHPPALNISAPPDGGDPHASTSFLWQQDISGTRHRQGRVAILRFNLTETLKAPVLMSYRLTKFFQNHLNYLQSLSYVQNAGGEITSSLDVVNCAPLLQPGTLGRSDREQVEKAQTVVDSNGNAAWKTYKDLMYQPCGAVAWSQFNDSFTLYKVDDHSDAILLNSSINNDNNNGRSHPNNFQTFSSSSPLGQNTKLLCNSSDFNFDGSKTRNGDVLNSASNPCTKSTLQYGSDAHRYKKPNLKNNDGALWLNTRHRQEGNEDNVSSTSTNVFFKNGWYADEPGHELPYVFDFDFQMWMRTAPLSDFRKLMRTINVDMTPGQYQVEVDEFFDTSSFGGQKYIVFETRSKFGGRNFGLPILYLVTGSLAIVLIVATGLQWWTCPSYDQRSE